MEYDLYRRPFYSLDWKQIEGNMDIDVLLNHLDSYVLSDRIDVLKSRILDLEIEEGTSTSTAVSFGVSGYVFYIERAE